MSNTLEKAKIFTSELDKAFPLQAATGWMDGNAGQVKYQGGNEVKVPSVVMSGMGDYSRTQGYPEGDIAMSYETLTMTQDRGRGFTLDAMDIDESGFALAMGALMGDFQREEVVPEVDAYRLSKLAQLAGSTRQKSYTPAAGTILKQMNEDIATVREKVGEGVELVMHISYAAYAVLQSSTEFSRRVNLGEFNGAIKQKVNFLDDVPLLRTRSALMKTKFTFLDGVTNETNDDQTAGGFKAASDAKQINWLIVARRAPIAVCKQDLVRLFDPQTWQKANAWHADYRKFHDLWVTKKKLDGLFANIGA